MRRIFQGILGLKRNDFFFSFNKFWHDLGLPCIEEMGFLKQKIVFNIIFQTFF